MPTYTVQAPSGKTYEVDAPEGATPEQLGQFILSQNKDERVAMTRAQMAKEYAPTVGMGVGERLLAGAGKGLSDMAQGAGQWLGITDRQDVLEKRALDAPLMDTRSGAVGSFAGKAIPAAAATFLFPGASAPLVAGGVGAGLGAIEPSASSGETVQNIALGGVFGAGGQKVANVVTDKLKQRAAQKATEFAAQQAANAQKLGAARDAQAAGYVIPPSDIQPQGAVMEALGGLSGKIKTAQSASVKNQTVSDKLARRALGLADDAPLTADVLDAMRSEAGKAYANVASLGKFDATGAALPKNVKVQESISPLLAGKTKSVDARELVESWKQANHDATAYYRAYARDANPETLAKAKANASAAKAIDDFLTGKVSALQSRTPQQLIQDLAAGKIDQAEFLKQTLLNASGKNLVSELKNARKLIAKSYTVEGALNSETGSVSAQALAKALEKGKPLEGDLLTIAKAGQAFPKATQALKEAPKELSPLDFGAAALGLVGSGGNPLAAAGLVARPAVRNALLTDLIQRTASSQKKPPSAAMANALANPLVRLLYGPSAAVPAMQIGQQ